MPTETLEERVEKLEYNVQEMQHLVAQQPGATKRGWRWFVGIYADSPDFDDVVRVGEEWRNADRPGKDDDGV